MADSKGDKTETMAIHAGEQTPRVLGSVSMPVFQTAIYEFDRESPYDSIPYIRLNNTPNALAVQGKLAALESAESALVTASGMAAISAALLACLRTGDHLLIQDCLYGGTHSLVTRDLVDLGITFDFIDANRPEQWATKLQPTTKVIYVESMSNPLLGVADLAAVSQFAQDNGLVSMVDNTFPSPINFRPAEWGYDLSLHSCTKYLNGHSDIVAGAVVGKSELVGRVRNKLNHLGGSLDPHACFLLHRGMKTLAVRMKAHNANAQILAEMLQDHPAVSAVNYPGLERHPDYARSARLFDGFSGMMSVELKGGVEAANKLIKHLRLPIHAPSLGGVESLITRPATTSHRGMTPEEREFAGVTDSLVRISVGIENPADLVDDFARVLDG